MPPFRHKRASAQPVNSWAATASEKLSAPHLLWLCVQAIDARHAWDALQGTFLAVGIGVGGASIVALCYLSSHGKRPQWAVFALMLVLVAVVVLVLVFDGVIAARWHAGHNATKLALLPDA